MPTKKSTIKKTPTKRVQSKKIINIPEPQVVEPLWIEEPQTIWRFDFGKFSFGLFLVVIGLLYLAKNSGWLPLDLQFDLWQLWPMLLIFFGLSFVSGKGWTGLITGSIFTMTVLVIAGIFISDKVSLRLEPELSNMPSMRGHLPSTPLAQDFPINIDKLSSSQTANLSINHGLGILNISAGSSEKLVLGKLSSNYAKLLINSQASADSQSVQLSSVAQKSQVAASASQLDLQLAASTPLNLDLNTGASHSDLNFQNLLVKNLHLSSSGSDINLTLASISPNQSLKLSGPINNLNLNLPSDLAIKISSSNISKLQLANFKSLDDNTIVTKNYKDASSTIDLSIESQPDKLIVNWQ